MTSDAVSAAGDPRRLLADVRDLARRVRVAQRVTWLPLLVLGVVVLGAIPVTRFGHRVISNCQVLADGQVCHVWLETATYYWFAGLALAYVVIAYGYLRVARSRGLGGRVLPYAISGFVIFALAGLTPPDWLLSGPVLPPDKPSELILLLFRLMNPTGMIGLALLVLAWLERHPALLVFTLIYLAVVLTPFDYVRTGEWEFAVSLAVAGGLLLLASAAFALAQRRSR
jgi:hypothetical protein